MPAWRGLCHGATPTSAPGHFRETLRLTGREALPGSRPYGAHHTRRKGDRERHSSLSNRRDREIGRPWRGTRRGTRQAPGGPTEKRGEWGGVIKGADEEPGFTPGKGRRVGQQPKGI
ncbi:hypothetical protein NDU88_011736 [Pleurodeles waltl]|uniref:Uncharacterized protein n=1 Tax=Pleurodeles waltl TaxID=8319 RepID=A0AAV7S220_PLEWA|nr:hypothetical protein NDU88_011736 [Pleurodeles waltl]